MSIVRRAGLDDAGRVSEILATAFYDDPVFRWCFPGDERRLAISEAFFRVNLEGVWITHGVVEVAGDGAAAAAVWLGPSAGALGEQEEAALDAANERVLGEFAPRAERAIALMAEAHPAEPHHYLPYVGVMPGHQGRGLGAVLLERGLQRCDRDGMGAYLDASAPRNRPLYERHGFSVTEEHHLPDGPVFWGMWRKSPQERSSVEAVLAP